ncbi:MAG: flagellar assembly protein FliW [Bacillus sp. (in: firmicutes)]
MKITTKYHGEMEFDEKNIWHFSNGIPGFPDEQQFILYPLADNEVFSILQSVASHEVAFVVASPFVFFPDYDFTLEDSVVSSLQLENSSDVLPLVILTLGDSLTASTANLQAPLILNTKNQKAKQVILHDTSFHTKHHLQQTVKQGG